MRTRRGGLAQRWRTTIDQRGRNARSQIEDAAPDRHTDARSFLRARAFEDAVTALTADLTPTTAFTADLTPITALTADLTPITALTADVDGAGAPRVWPRG